jgi:L-ribulose-5-phosphate 3-epimerase
MNDIKLGMLVALEDGAERAIQQVHDLGFPTCQVICWDVNLYRPEVARRLRLAVDRLGVEITTLWSGTVGTYVWDFVDGPSTIGLVPVEMRAARMQALRQASEFARWVNIPSITTHVGFVPENPADPLYAGVIDVLEDVATYCDGNGQAFWFETGQETPITLLRAIQDVGMDNLGVNLDPANLLAYGKGNPVDALDILGPYVKGVHAKDGEYPTDPRELGAEKPLGEGRVDFPTLIAKLKALGYTGALTIEREITGPQQIADIKAGKVYLESILASLGGQS